MPPRGADDAELELPLRDAVDHGLRVRDRERDGDPGVRALELAEEQRDDGAAGAGRGADRERAAQRPAVAGVQLLDELLLELQHALRSAVEREARFRRLDAAA